jgi:hypothetical protein
MTAGISTATVAYSGGKLLQSGHQLINGIKINTGNISTGMAGFGGAGALSTGISVSIEAGLAGSLGVASKEAIAGSMISYAGSEGTRSTQWVDEAGNIKWPPNNGFDGTPTTKTLKPGTIVDRYGGETGKFVSPKGTPYTNRSLPPGSDARPYNVYEVVKPIDVQSGKIAPWFDQPGGGIQYQFPQSIEELIRSGHLRRLP